MNTGPGQQRSVLVAILHRGLSRLLFFFLRLLLALNQAVFKTAHDNEELLETQSGLVWIQIFD